MTGIYRGWWWAYVGGGAVGLMIARVDGLWFLMPAFLVAAVAVYARVDR